MPPTERLQREVDPNKVLELHLKGLKETTNHINEFRVTSGLGKASRIAHKHRPLGNPRNEFAMTAQTYLDKIKPRDRNERMYASLLAITPPMVDALGVIDNRWAHDKTKQAAKHQMAKVNETFRNIIDSNPTIQPKTLLDIIHSVLLSYGYGADELNMASNAVENRLVGMRHEHAFGAFAFRLNGYEVADTTIADDMGAADWQLISDKNGSVVSIDVKNSPETAEEAISEADEYYYYAGERGIPRNKLILYSGFGPNDFDPHRPWTAKEDAIKRELPRIEAAVRWASGDNTLPAPAGHMI